MTATLISRLATRGIYVCFSNEWICTQCQPMHQSIRNIGDLLSLRIRNHPKTSQSRCQTTALSLPMAHSTFRLSLASAAAQSERSSSTKLAKQTSGDTEGAISGDVGGFPWRHFPKLVKVHLGGILPYPLVPPVSLLGFPGKGELWVRQHHEPRPRRP